MSTRHDDTDGSDIFWPGYVDATTNLILNLLFLLTILIVAVFMFALELGRTSKVVAEKAAVETVESEVRVAGGGEGPDRVLTSGEMAITGQGAVVLPAVDPVRENILLKREIESLRKLLEERAAPESQGGDVVRSVDATIAVSPPKVGVDETLSTDMEVMVRFLDDAVAFTDEERDQLLDALRPIAMSGHARISVAVPAGFSEAKRMGYYRAMAVRNLLIEMNLPGERIDVAITEVDRNANAALIRVHK